MHNSVDSKPKSPDNQKHEWHQDRAARQPINEIVTPDGHEVVDFGWEAAD